MDIYVQGVPKKCPLVGRETFSLRDILFGTPCSCSYVDAAIKFLDITESDKDGDNQYIIKALDGHLQNIEIY